MGQLNPVVYRNAKEVAVRLKAELEPLILGRTFGAWKCGCGCISKGAASAIEVSPAGMDPRYEDQIGLWYMWTVNMREEGNHKLKPGDFSYSIGLSTFVDVTILKEMFLRYFDGIGVDVSRS